MGNIFIWVVVVQDRFTGEVYECVGFGSHLLAENYVATHSTDTQSFSIHETLAEDVEVE